MRSGKLEIQLKHTIVEGIQKRRTSISNTGSSTGRSRFLPRPPSCRFETFSRHCVKSWIKVSRAGDFPPCCASASSCKTLSRVLTRRRAVMLLSRLTAAVSLSGHSERLTNWNLASATSSARLDEPALAPGAAPAASSFVSLNSCSVAATLRPMPAVGGWDIRRSRVPCDELEALDDEEYERPDRGRAALASLSRWAKAEEEDEEGRVSARVAALRRAWDVRGTCLGDDRSVT